MKAKEQLMEAALWDYSHSPSMQYQLDSALATRAV
jgi:hypothetical protein